MVLEVEERQLGVVPGEGVAVDVGLEESELGDPVELTVEGPGVPFESGEDRFPAVEDLVADGFAAGFESGLVGVLLGEAEELPLELDGGHARSVGELDRGATGRVVGDGAHGGDGAGEGPVLAGIGAAGVHEVVFDHGEHDGRGADLEEGGDLAEVGVAGDDVESPVLLRVGVGLVAGVHDRAFQGRFEADFLLEEVGSLAELVVDGGGAVLGADLAGAGEDLAGGEPREEVADEVGERDGAVHEVVLVAAVGVALPDDDRLAGLEDPRRGLHRSGQDALAGLVGDDELEGIGALGGGVLGVGVVDVVAGTVGEDGVDEVGLDLGGLGAFAGVAAGVAAG